MAKRTADEGPHLDSLDGPDLESLERMAKRAVGSRRKSLENEIAQVKRRQAAGMAPRDKDGKPVDPDKRLAHKWKLTAADVHRFRTLYATQTRFKTQNALLRGLVELGFENLDKLQQSTAEQEKR